MEISSIYAFSVCREMKYLYVCAVRKKKQEKLFFFYSLSIQFASNILAYFLYNIYHPKSKRSASLY